MLHNFTHIEQAPPDPILGLTALYKEDSHDLKLNLGVGAYRTDEQQPYVLNVVKKTEAILLEQNLDKEYLPIDGYPKFLHAATNLVLGADSVAVKDKRVCTVQSVGGTGALRVCAEFIKLFFPDATCYVPNPTWGNHKQIFAQARVKFGEYRYYNPKTHRLDLPGLLDDIRSARRGSFFLLHACAHNPTGIDPTPEQWEIIAAALQDCGHVPLFDFAYQGFASGSMEQDAYVIRMFVDRGWECFIAQSYSKNLGFYGERLGSLIVVTSNEDEASRVRSQLKRIIRALYSNPPSYGAKVAAHIMTTPALFAEWEDDVRAMSKRLQTMRRELYEALIKNETPGDWSHIKTQIGMFSYLGLTKEQVKLLVEKHHMYLTSNARISIAGLSSRTVPYLADAIKSVVIETATDENQLAAKL